MAERDALAEYRATALEHDEQVALFRQIRLHLDDYPDLDMAFAVPMGGWRAKRTAARLKAEGARAGIPDILIPVRRLKDGHIVSGLAIEMKVPGKKPTAQQRWWLTGLERQGWLYSVCYGWESAWAEIERYMGLERLPGRTPCSCVLAAGRCGLSA